METEQKGFIIRIFTLVTFLAMVAVNALANILPINGIMTGAVSDAYPNLFAPAGITFAVWGVIYFLLALYTLYHLGLFQKDKSKVNTKLLQKTGILFSVSSLANTAWIFSWHYDDIPLSMLLMGIILICLIFITHIIKKEQLTTGEKLLVRLPFSVYFGWITVATVANATVLLKSLNFSGFGIPETIWAILILAVAAVIGIAAMVRNRDVAYGLVLLWAYTGILIKHISADGFAGKYPAVIAAVVVCLVLLVVALVYVVIPQKRAEITSEKPSEAIEEAAAEPIAEETAQDKEES